MDLKTEFGYSMVEVLGTLAIIGVLSIGGFAGYSYAIDKYKANKTMNDIVLIGVDIITQLSQNRATPTLSEWETKTTAGYDFTVVPNPENETQYGIQITGVPSSICKMVGDGLKQTVAVYVGNEDYNSNTENDPCDESNSNTMEFYFNTGAVETDGCKTDADCGENKYCDLGLCFNGVRPEMTARVFDKACTSDAECNTGWSGSCSSCNRNLGYCVEKYDMHNKACTLSDGTIGKCGAGECLPIGCTYSTNKCGDKEYCASPNNSCETAFQTGESGSCVAFNARFSPLTIDGITYYVSNSPLSWWDADAGCKSVGKKLLNVSDLVTGWSGTSGTVHTKTALSEKIRSEAFGGEGYRYIWTSDDYTSCEAFYVYLSVGFVYAHLRHYDSREYGSGFAICK